MAQSKKALQKLDQVACKVHDPKTYDYVADYQNNVNNGEFQLLCHKCMKDQQSDLKPYAICDAADGINIFLDEYDKGKEKFLDQLTKIEQQFDEMLRKFKLFMKQRIDSLKKSFDNPDVMELKKMQERDIFSYDDLNKFVRIQRKFIIVSPNVKEAAQIAEDYLKKEFEREMQLDQIVNWFTQINSKCFEFQNDKPDVNLYISKRLFESKIPNHRMMQQVNNFNGDSIIINGFQKKEVKVERFIDKQQIQTIINQTRNFYVQMNKSLNLKGIYISSDIDFKDQEQVELEFKIYHEDQQDNCYFQNTFKLKAPLQQSKEDNYLVLPNVCSLEAKKYYTFSLLNKSKPIKCRLYEMLANIEEMNFIQNPNLGKWKYSFNESEFGLIKAFQFEI